MSVRVFISSPTHVVKSVHRQSGIALVVALILLVVISLIGLAAVSGTSVQQKISANFNDRQIAFQSAEAALRAAELAVAATPTAAYIRDCSASGIVCAQNPFSDSSLPSGATQTVSTSTFNPGAIAGGNQPQYVIELMGTFAIPDPNVKLLSNCIGYNTCSTSQTAVFYRITARSGPADVGDRASVTLQTMFKL